MSIKKGIAKLAFAGIALTQVFQVVPVSANQLDQIREEKTQKEQNLSQLESEVDSVLSNIETKNNELNQLNEEVNETASSIDETQNDIAHQEEVVDARLEQAKSRLQSIQTNETNQNIILSLLESESLSDLINKATVAIQLTRAGNEQIELAQTEVEELEELKADLEYAQKDLESKVASTEDAKTELDQTVSELQTLVADNQSQINELAQAESAEVARIQEAQRVAQEEAERQKVLVQAQVEKEEQAVTTSSNQPEEVQETNNNSQPKEEKQEENNNSQPKEEKQEENNNSQQKQEEQKADTQSQPAPEKPVEKEAEPVSQTSGGSEHAAKEWIAERESGGDYNAVNPTGKYIGRYQLTNSYLGGDHSPANQERVANNYVNNRYGSWVNAKSHWEVKGWY